MVLARSLHSAGSHGRRPELSAVPRCAGISTSGLHWPSAAAPPRQWLDPKPGLLSLPMLADACRSLHGARPSAPRHLRRLERRDGSGSGAPLQGALHRARARRALRASSRRAVPAAAGDAAEAAGPSLSVLSSAGAQRSSALILSKESLPGLGQRMEEILHLFRQPARTSSSPAAIQIHHSKTARRIPISIPEPTRHCFQSAPCCRVTASQELPSATLRDSASLCAPLAPGRAAGPRPRRRRRRGRRAGPAARAAHGEERGTRSSSRLNGGRLDSESVRRTQHRAADANFQTFGFGVSSRPCSRRSLRGPCRSGALSCTAQVPAVRTRHLDKKAQLPPTSPPHSFKPPMPALKTNRIQRDSTPHDALLAFWLLHLC